VICFTPLIQSILHAGREPFGVQFAILWSMIKYTSTYYVYIQIVKVNNRNKKTISWKSKYGSVSFSLSGIDLPCYGVNEKRLFIVELYLDNTLSKPCWHRFVNGDSTCIVFIYEIVPIKSVLYKNPFHTYCPLGVAFMFAFLATDRKTCRVFIFKTKGYYLTA